MAARTVGGHWRWVVVAVAAAEVLATAAAAAFAAAVQAPRASPLPGTSAEPPLRAVAATPLPTRATAGGAVALACARVPAPPRGAGDPSASAAYLCATNVTVTADAGSCASKVVEEWTWPYTTGRDAQRVIPAADMAGGVKQLAVYELPVDVGGGGGGGRTCHPWREPST